jgi:hypothetical protein
MVFVRLLGAFTVGREEQDQIGHQQETGQVDQVAGFEQNGGYGAFTMNPERLQDDNRYDVYKKKSRNKYEM